VYVPLNAVKNPFVCSRVKTPVPSSQSPPVIHPISLLPQYAQSLLDSTTPPHETAKLPSLVKEVFTVQNCSKSPSAVYAYHVPSEY